MSVRLVKGESPTSHTLHLPGIRIVFSYETPVAFCDPHRGWVVCENVWGPTTGKHLNQLAPLGAGRIAPNLFEATLDAALCGRR